MKKITLLLFSLTVCFSYAKIFDGSMEEDVVVIEILDETMDDIYYHDTDFASPTKLLFKNLTNVEGDVHFFNNHNLVEVSFPKLQTVDGKFYFEENDELSSVSTPVINYVFGRIQIYENALIEEFDFKFLEATGGITVINNNLLRNILLPILHSSKEINFQDNPALEKLILPQLTGAELIYFYANHKLINLEFPSLESIIGLFKISENSILLSVSAPILSSVEEIQIHYNTNLIHLNLCHLAELISNNPDLKPYGDVYNNTEAVDSGNWCVLGANYDDDVMYYDVTTETLEGAQYCNINYPSPTILRFPYLKSVDGDFEFCFNSNLVGIEAPILETVSQNLYIQHNNELLNVSFASLKQVDGVIGVMESPALKEISIPNLKEIGMDFGVYSNPVLEKLICQNIVEICGGLSFFNNYTIEEFDLPFLKSVGHCGEHIGSFIHFSNNDSLVNINIPKLEITGDLIVSNNLTLETLNVSSLQIADMQLSVSNNPKLKILDLTNLSKVETSLNITNNNSIESIIMPNLKEVGPDLYISSNQSLNTLDLRALLNTGYSIAILQNELLEYLNLCSYEPPKLEYDENNYPINGYLFQINNNDIVDAPPYCPDEREDDEDHTPDADSEETRNNVSIYPNPAEDHIHLDCEVSIDRVIIYDLSGNVIKAFTSNESYDISDIPPGIYLMMIFKEDILVNTNKLVIK